MEREVSADFSKDKQTWTDSVTDTLVSPHEAQSSGDVQSHSLALLHVCPVILRIAVDGRPFGVK